MVQFKFDSNGLIPAVVQDRKSRKVLMVAYVNRRAIRKMLALGKTCFYSRSRQVYWIKGETSGHIQRIKRITTDCDRDALLIEVDQVGGACHLGYQSCFVHQLNSKGKLKRVTQKKVFDPKLVYLRQS